MMTVPFLLALLAFVFAGIAQYQSKGRNLLGWAVIFLALIYLLPAWR